MFWPAKALSLEEFVDLVRKRTGNLNIAQVVSTIHLHRNRLNSFRFIDARRVLWKVRGLLDAGEDALVRELLIQNHPPRTNIRPPAEQFVWCILSSIAFQAGGMLPEEASRRMIVQCLKEPTDMAFALLHSESIGSLVRAHPLLGMASLVEVVISGANDSRALYALRVARWLPEWASLKSAVFNAMLTSTQPKQTEAFWLANERASMDDAIAFSEIAGIEIPQELRISGDVRQVNRFLVRIRLGVVPSGITYAVKAGGEHLSSGELAKLSDWIEALLKENPSKSEHSSPPN